MRGRRLPLKADTTYTRCVCQDLDKPSSALARTKIDSSVLTMLTTSAPKKAAQNPET